MKKFLDFSDITPIDLQDETIGPINFEDYEKSLLKMVVGALSTLLPGYTDS